MAVLLNTTIDDTGSIQLPAGTIAQRPVPAAGMIRCNTETGRYEFYNGSYWIDTATGSPSIITNGLTLHLDAGDAKSYPKTGTVWYDITGNGRNATLFNSIVFDTNNSGSFLKNSTAQFIQLISSNYNIADAYTVSFWVRRIGGTGIFLYIGQSGSTGMYFESYGNTDITTWFFGPNPAQAVSWGNILSTTAWVNVAMTMTTSTRVQTRYINGTNIGSTTLTNSVNAPSQILATSSISDSNAPWTGYFSNLQIHNRVLSANEVQQNFNAVRGRYGI
jgi:hypothetical protein